MADWALILGSSSGFGEAAARAFAAAGTNIFGVHLDRKSTLGHVDELVEAIKETGVEIEFFNVNAADPEKRGEVVQHVAERLAESGEKVRVVLHSLAFGALKPYIDPEGKAGLAQRELDMTLDVMAHSLIYWTQDVVARGLMGPGGRIFAMTSGGGARVLPNYGPVSGAKAALESHVRQLAMELAPWKITVNAVRAGVTDTPALQKIPGSDRIKAGALARNPYGRLTTTEDVARAIVAFSHSSTYWMTGNVLQVDGGEDVAG